MFPFQERLDYMKKKKRMGKEMGQAIVEVALAIPIILFLLCGIIDFGRILYAGITINMVAQESVRYAGLNKDKTSTEVSQFGVNNCSLSNKSTCLTVSCDSQAPRSSGSYVKVSVSYNVNYITPLMKPIIGEYFRVQTSSTIRVE